MAALCTICADPRRQEIDSRALAGESGHRISQELGISVASLYRHLRARHHKEALRAAQQAAQNGAGAPIASEADSALTAQVTESLRDAQRLMRLAWSHLKATNKGADPKATNGAIQAANKTLELIAELRGHLKSRGGTQITVTAEARAALAAQEEAAGLGAHDEVSAAGRLLGAYLEAGDAHAIAAVGELMRMLPTAEPQALTPATSRSDDAHPEA